MLLYMPLDILIYIFWSHRCVN